MLRDFKKNRVPPTAETAAKRRGPLGAPVSGQKWPPWGPKIEPKWPQNGPKIAILSGRVPAQFHVILNCGNM